MANVGDKFVIEIDKVFTESNNGNKLYRIKGFNSLVFDENGISKLKKYEQPLFKKDYPTVGSVWNGLRQDGVSSVVIVNNRDDVIFGIDLEDRCGLVLPLDQFVARFAKTDGDYSTELGIIFGDLPF